MASCAAVANRRRPIDNPPQLNKLPYKILPVADLLADRIGFFTVGRQFEVLGICGFGSLAVFQLLVRLPEPEVRLGESRIPLGGLCKSLLRRFVVALFE